MINLLNKMRTLLCVSFLLLSILSVINGLDIQPRIVNGFAAKRSEYPFYVFLVTKNAQRKVGWCGGSLISDRFIVTAAHCTENAEKIAVCLGSWKARNHTEIGRERIVIMKRNIFIHPKYSKKWLMNDISLIRLDEAVQFSQNILPIRLQEACESNEDTRVVAVGNGFFSEKHRVAPILQWAPMITVSFIECAKYNPFVVFHRNQNTICAVNIEGRTIRKGDSGGPLIRNGRLIGITSFVPANNELTSPHGFVNVIDYHGWISNITNLPLKTC